MLHSVKHGPIPTFSKMCCCHQIQNKQLFFLIYFLFLGFLTNHFTLFFYTTSQYNPQEHQLQLCAVCFQLMPYLITLILTLKHLHMTGVNVSRCTWTPSFGKRVLDNIVLPTLPEQLEFQEDKTIMHKLDP